jgi:[ribosomal protein S5]-alanine N-acetyltransferase
VQVFVETDRLILREIVASDANDMFLLDSDPLVNKYLGNKPVKSLAESSAIIEFIRKQYQDNGIGRWAVILKQTNAFIGWSGLKLEDGIREDNYYDLGYRFIPKYWEKGYATEAAIASLDYGFNTLKYNEICAAAEIDNIGSNKVIQKLGMSWIETFMFENDLHNWYELKRQNWLSDKINSD